jgi:hypothetical protein
VVGDHEVNCGHFPLDRTGGYWPIGQYNNSRKMLAQWLPERDFGAEILASLDPLNRIADVDCRPFNDPRGDAAVPTHGVVAAWPERLLHAAARRAFA